MTAQKVYPLNAITVAAILVLCGTPVLADGIPQGGFYAMYATPVGPLDIFSYHKDFVQDGYHFEYYNNGDIKQMAFYRNGLPDGVHVGYYENGYVFFRENFQDGKREGQDYHYYPNGNLKLTVQYHNGLANGEARFYAESGQLEKVNTYDKGRIVKLLRYDPKGNMVEERRFN